MKNNLLIIGKKSFIGKNLYNYSRKKRPTYLKSFKQFININQKSLSSFNTIINCTSNNNYINKKYDIKNDFDLKIAKKIKNLNTMYILLSSRKVYKNGTNLNEKSTIRLKSNYSKNKFITEKKLQKILNNKLLILRLSNVIGIRSKNSRRLHKTFIDYYFENIKKGMIFKFNREYKDFLGIDQLTRVLDKVVENKLSGKYNVSLGKKVYLREIINWLNYFNLSKYRYIKLKKSLNNESFTLSNKKLLKDINFKIIKKDLETECKKISKIFFKKKK